MMHLLILKGGAGSGNYGHKGRNGQRGGSLKAWRPDDTISVVLVRPDALYSGGDLGGLRRAAVGYVRRLQEEVRAGSPLHNTATGWDWEINKVDRDKLAKDYARTAVDLRAVANLRDLAAVAIRGESHADYKGSDQVRAVHRFYAPVLLGDKLFRLKLTVKDMLRGSRNLHCLKSVEIENPAVITPLLASLRAGPSEQQPAGLAVTVAQLLDDAKREDGSLLLHTKKALPFGGALQSQSTMRTAPQAPPDLEGIPFDWTARFRDSHHGKAEAFDWQTGCKAEYSPADALLKADIPTGARWITAHPNGPGTKGTPLLIQETHEGSGVSHVIGGAGGKLNYLRLKPSQRDPAEAHQDAAERRKAKATAKKAQREQEKATGTHKNKQLARQEVDSARRVKEDEFIDHVAGAMGWEGHKFDPEAHPGLSDKALVAAASKHHREWMSKANEAVNRHKQALLNDDDARAQALGHDPLVAGPGPLDVSDLGLQPARKAQMGTAINYTKEAEKRGASDEAIQREAKETAPEPSEATTKRKATGESIAAELDGYRSGADTAPLTQEDPDAWVGGQVLTCAPTPPCTSGPGENARGPD